MQTFLTDHSDNLAVSIRRTARDLDWQRLGKQRVEAYQIIRSLTGVTKGWANHPATRMWRDHVETLQLYHDAMIDEWVLRGFKNNMKRYFGSWKVWPAAPDWFTPELVVSHRSNLIRKRPDIYKPIWPDVPDDLPYIWPVT